MPEWLKGADCKSVGLRLRWFESNPLHHFHSLPVRVGSSPRPVSSGCITLTGVLPPIPDTRLHAWQGVQPHGMFVSRRSPSGYRHASGCSSMVEQKPSKLTTRVRFPSPAPVSTEISPLQQTPERVLCIPLTGAGQSFLSDAGAVLGLGRHVPRIAGRGARCRHSRPVCRRRPSVGHDRHHRSRIPGDGLNGLASGRGRLACSCFVWIRVTQVSGTGSFLLYSAW